MASRRDISTAARSRRYRERQRTGALSMTFDLPPLIVERMIEDRMLTDAESLDRTKIAAAVVAMLVSWARGRAAAQFFRHAVAPNAPPRPYGGALAIGKRT
jgi:hypothetical protein